MSESESKWLPLRSYGDQQYIDDTGYHWLVASARGNALKVSCSLQCGMQHNLYHTTWFRSEGQYFRERDKVGWRKSETTGETLCEKVIVRQFAPAHNWILAGDDPTLHTMNAENDLEMWRSAEQRTLHTMPKVYDFLGMWPGSQNLHATQKESRAQNKQMTSGEYTSDTEELVKASWWNFRHGAGAAFKLSQRSPVPPALSAKDLPGGRTRLLNARRMKTINCHPAESDEDSAPEGI